MASVYAQPTLSGTRSTSPPTQHTQTARLFSMSLHTRKGPQPNRFSQSPLPYRKATWGTGKCHSGRAGRAQKYATTAAISAIKTAAVVSVWCMRKLTLYAGIPTHTDCTPLFNKLAHKKGAAAQSLLPTSGVTSFPTNGFRSLNNALTSKATAIFP